MLIATMATKKVIPKVAKESILISRFVGSPPLRLSDDFAQALVSSVDTKVVARVIGYAMFGLSTWRRGKGDLTMGWGGQDLKIGRRFFGVDRSSPLVMLI